MNIENNSEDIKTNNIEISRIEDAIYTEIEDTENKENIKHYFYKNYNKIKWSFGAYHIVFGIWAFITLLNIVVSNIFSSLFSIPLLIYIFCSILGGFKLIKNERKSINLLLIAQIPQILILQINGFFYSLIAGQWITFTVVKEDIFKFGFNFGILGSTYNLIFQSGLNGNGFGINVVPIIAILILLKIEEIDFEKPLE